MCIPEPTVEPIDFGVLINCEINPVGDMDTYRFEGSDGDKIRPHGISHSPGSRVCVKLFDPDGFFLIERCGSVNIQRDLDKNGEYSVEVNEQGIDSTMDYELSYQCIGVCPPACDPFVDVCKGDFAYDYIVKIYDEEITTGCSKNPPKYCPSSPVTRAQMAIFW